MAKADPPQPSELDEHPGRPRGRDEIDPELVVLPRPRPRIGWLLALSVLVFCAFYFWRLRSDLAFSMQGDTPDRLASIEAAAGAEPDRYVEVEAVPDRASLLRVAATDAGHRLAPVLGSGGQLWVMFAGNHWYEPNRYGEVYQGRVKRLGDLPFYDQLVAKLRSMPPAPRIVSLEALTEAIAAGATSMNDVAGDAMQLAPDTPVVVSERVAGRAHITGFDTELLHDEDAWRAALDEAGVLSSNARLLDKTLKSWTFETDAPEGLEALGARLVAAKLYAARAEPLDIEHHTTWSQLGTRGQALVLSNEDSSLEVPGSSIRAVAVLSPRTAPASARVILTTDEPDDYWYVLPLYIVFGLFALLFGWALWRALRTERVEQPSS